jgi:hypothetical protein
MPARFWMRRWMAIGSATALFVFALTPPTPGDEAKSVSDEALIQARERAKLMHEVYASTLDVMHHHFFKPNNPVLPARALEDVFADMARKANVEARWLAINTKAMSIDHEPKSEFDRKAVAALSAGEKSYEQIADGHLQRVGAIPLGGGCVSCHAGIFARPTKAPRVAGLVITVPFAKK